MSTVKTSRKASQRSMVAARLETALQDLYHNATPHHPYRDISDLQQDEYSASGRILANTPEDAESAGFGTDARWERITDYGKLYQYGRGGRTLAPANLVTGGAYHWYANADAGADLGYEDRCEMLLIVESFNRHVAMWCSAENLRYLWQERCSDIAQDALERAQDELAEAGYMAG